MNLQEIIDELRAYLDQIDTALVCSEASQGKKEEWLLCALALLSKYYDTDSEENKDLLFDEPYGYRQKAFQKAASLTLDAIKNEKSIEAFISEAAVGLKDYTLSRIKKLVENYLKNQNVEWKSVETAINNVNVESLNGYIKDFAVCLINLKSEFTSALEEWHSEEDIFDWYCAVFAVYCSTPEAVSSFISDALGKYFDRWHIEGTDEYFPYSMDKTSHVKNQVGTTWDTINGEIISAETTFLKALKVDRYAYYKNKYEKVELNGYDKNGGEVSNAPYVKLLDSGKLINSEEVSSWYRKPDDNEEQYEETFDFQHYSAEKRYSNTAGAKGSPEVLNYVYKILKEKNLITDREGLVHYGIGIDCSGFVSRAIVDIMITLRIPVPKQFKSIGHGYGRLKTNAATLRKEGSVKLFRYHPDNKKSKKLKENSETDYQDYLRPGDIIMRKELDSKEGELEHPFHILIIKDVTKNSFEVWNSKSLGSEGPRCDTYKSIKEFLEREEYTIQELTDGHKLIVDIRRPKILNDLNYLIPYYLEYLEGGEW